MRAIFLVLLAGCGSSVVGAECAAGFVVCDGQCVDLSSDARHCGACGVVCTECDRGMCVGPMPDAGIGDAAIGSDPEDPIDEPPFVRSCGIGELECGAACVRPDSDPRHCGACGSACASGQVCAGTVCADVCAAPRAICGGACVDPTSDPAHCGGCGIACESGVCNAGVCAAEVAGHVVLVGHDYVESRAAMDRVAGNAVLLGRGAPVRVLAYEGRADAASIAGVYAAIDRSARETGRPWTYEVAAAELVSLELAQADVLVIHAQTFADKVALERIGRGWKTALAAFLRTGGVVVVFEGEGGSTHRILSAAAVIEHARRADITREVLSVVAPTDAVAVGVPLSYRGERTTVRFDARDGVAVIADAIGPVVVHYTVLP
jgi:hypothetical protein